MTKEELVTAAESLNVVALLRIAADRIEELEAENRTLTADLRATCDELQLTQEENASLRQKLKELDEATSKPPAPFKGDGVKDAEISDLKTKLADALDTIQQQQAHILANPAPAGAIGDTGQVPPEHDGSLPAEGFRGLTKDQVIADLTEKLRQASHAPSAQHVQAPDGPVHPEVEMLHQSVDELTAQLNVAQAQNMELDAKLREATAAAQQQPAQAQKSGPQPITEDNGMPVINPLNATPERIHSASELKDMLLANVELEEIEDELGPEGMAALNRVGRACGEFMMGRGKTDMITMTRVEFQRLIALAVIGHRLETTYAQMDTTA